MKQVNKSVPKVRWLGPELGLGLAWILMMAGGLQAADDARGTNLLSRVVQPGDGLIIDVVDEPDLRKVERKVDAKGRITYHFLGELEVQGKTTAEIEKMIHDGLDRDWIIDPQVSVLVGVYVEQTVSVGGFVNREGPVKLPVDRKLTLVEAISMAGGINLRGNPKKIQLSRRGEVKEYNLNELNHITDPDKQVFVEHGDVITIRQKAF